MKTETVTQQDGWQYQRVIDVDKMSALELLALYKDRDASAELVLVYDDESESAEPTFQDMVQHIQDGGTIGLYPIKPTPLLKFHIEITTTASYEIKARNMEEALKLSETIACEGEPYDLDSENPVVRQVSEETVK